MPDVHQSPEDAESPKPLGPVAREIANFLRHMVSGHEVVRIWGRGEHNMDAGAEANVWAGSPEDLAHELERRGWLAEPPDEGIRISTEPAGRQTGKTNRRPPEPTVQTSMTPPDKPKPEGS